MLTSFILSLAAAGLATAAPSATLSKRFLDCMNPVEGLSPSDCNSLSRMGFAHAGNNPRTPNDYIWIGQEGPFRFHFKNEADIPQTLVLWSRPTYDPDNKDRSPWLADPSVKAAEVTYSLAANGAEGSEVTISMGKGVSGGYSWVNAGLGIKDGLIDNTWGEFTTGNGGPGTGCTNVSRLANMNGRSLSIRTSICTSNLERCAFVCNNGAQRCGELGTVDVWKCTPDVNEGSGIGTNGVTPAPEGGCYGFDNEGDIHVSLG